VTPQVFWIPEADAEVKDARSWYQSIRPELGQQFARAIEATVEAIVGHPLQFPVIHRKLRRAGVRRFPYGIFYEIQESRIVVVACFHAKRDPKHWQGR
jgi:plasmid stabilization system protein ParE